MSGLCELPMYPTLTSFRPPSGMRCDSRLLSSFITGALTATTVTLFLLRVVPGTYVVLPCDPTITARPVLMEEYFDHIEKQEVFPEDSLIDTRPLQSQGAKDTAALHSRKSRSQKKKKKKTPQDQSLSHQKQNSKAVTQTAKEAGGGPRDLQHQLKDLQEKESLKGSVWSVDVKHQPKQKRKIQEQLQIKQHLEEIQLHLQKQSEEIKRKLEEEKKKKKLEEMPQGKYNSQTNLAQNDLSKSSDIPSKNIDNKAKSDKELKSQMENNEIPVRRKRDAYTKKNSLNKTSKIPKLPDSKLLGAIIKRKEGIKINRSDPLGLYTNNYSKLLHNQNRGSSRKQLPMQETVVTKTYNGAILSVPKFSRPPPLKTKSSRVPP